MQLRWPLPMMLVLIGLTSGIVTTVQAQSPTTSPALSHAERLSRLFGTRANVFEIQGSLAFTLPPINPRTDGTKPWLWFAPTFLKNIPDRSHVWMFKQLLESGFTVAGVDVGESYGNPKGRAIYTALHQHLVREQGLSPKACLLPQSRGGLMLYNWAAENPQNVQCIGGIYTVCDMTSYPGLQRACGAYQMSQELLQERLAEHNPIDRLEPLAKANIPILHLHGDADKTVPLEQNSRELVKRYQALGGKAELLVIPGKWHQVCPEFFQNRRLLDFFLSQGRDPAK